MKVFGPQGIAAATAPMVVLWRRVRAHWLLLLVLLAGAIMATTLLASAPLFLSAVQQIGLQHSLRTERTGVIDPAVRVPHRPLDPATFASLDRLVQAQADTALGDRVVLRLRHVRTPAMTLKTDPERGVPANVRANLLSYSDYEHHVRPVLGTFPRRAGGQPARRLEGAIGAGSAHVLGLQVGDELELTPHSLDPGRKITILITGVLEATDAQEAYWSFSVSPFRLQVDGSTGAEVPMLPVILSEDALVADVASALRGSLADYWWYFYVDPAVIQAEDTQALRSKLVDWESGLALELPGSDLFTALGDTLAAFEQKVFFSRIPILVLLVLLVTLVLYYIGLVANLVADRHLGEVALLRSRGARGSQVLALYLWEAAAIAVCAGAVAPIIGLAVVPLLGKAPGFAAATGGALLPVSLTQEAWLASVGAAALCFISLLFPALRSARFNQLGAKARAGRPPRMTALHKYNLDLFLLAMTGLFYWELTQRGSLVTRRIFGEQSTDFVLLLMPAMLMAGVALLALRFIPVVLLLLSHMASAFGRVSLVLALWTVARDPGRYVRPAVLLTLVAGLAMFSASLNATVSKSFQDRGRYAVGSDVLVSGLSSKLRAGPEQLAARFEEAPGVRYAAAAFRSLPRTGSENDYQLLAVHTTDIQRVSWRRDDLLSQQDLFTMLRRLDRGRGVTQGLDLPEGITSLGLWVNPAESYQNMSLWLLVKDGEGRPWRLSAGFLNYEGWRFLSARTDSSPGVQLPGPLVLHAILLRELDSTDSSVPFDQLVLGFISSGQVNLSDLTVTTQAIPEGVVLEAFRSPEHWQVMATSSLPQQKLAASPGLPRNGLPSTEFSWKSASGVGTRGIFPSDYHEPLPVVAGGSFLQVTGSGVGDIVDIMVEGIPLPARIVDVVSSFPTMDPREPFILGNVETLMHMAGLFRALPDLAPNEVWLALEPDPDQQQEFVAWLRASPYSPYVARDLGETLAKLTRDPLVGASSRGTVFTAFCVLLIVGVGGYLGYLYISSFGTAAEFAVLRAIGLSPFQLLVMQALVQGLVLIGSALLGGGVGLWAHQAMIEFLGHTERGGELIPPLSPQVDWSGLVLMLVTFSTLLVIVLGRMVWSFVRTRVWLELRAGGE